MAAVAMVLSGAAMAATKSDIAGFYSGMPDIVFKDRLAGLNCETDTCQFDGKVIQFRRSADRSIHQVAFRFTSTLKPRDQIAATARETTRPGDIGDIGNAMGRYENLPIVGARLMTGGEICRWRLSNGMTLALNLDMPGETFTYILHLVKS
jgi:hypothetical protein